MASTEVMYAGVRVAAAFLLSRISTLLAKGEEKEICLGEELEELTSEDRESHQNHLRMSPH
jgi:hypothetical protein